MTTTFHEWSDRDALAHGLADAILRLLRNALNDHGVAHLAVSGGSTPRRFFEVLSNRPFEWDKVSILLVDERWVPDTDARSNARTVRESLMQDQAAIAEFQPLYNDAATAEAGVAETMRLAGGVAYSVDALVLGMGLDGHTASLFPGGDNLKKALDPAGTDIFLPMNAPHLDESRITMTLPVLLNAGALFLHIEGQEKRAVLEKAQQDGAIEDMPIRAVINHPEKPVSVFWTE